MPNKVYEMKNEMKSAHRIQVCVLVIFCMTDDKTFEYIKRLYLN